MSAAEDLARSLAEPLEDDRPDTPDGFVIDNLDKATWAVRKIAQHRRRRDEAVAAAQAERDRIDAWLVAELDRYDSSTAYLQDLLRRYHQQRISEDNPTANGWAEVKESKTVRTPAGDLVARKAPDRVEVDEAQFVPWALTHAIDLLNPPKPRTPDKRAIKDLAELLTIMADGTLANAETGEFLPGVVWVDGDVTYTVKTPEVGE